MFEVLQLTANSFNEVIWLSLYNKDLVICSKDSPDYPL